MTWRTSKWYANLKPRNGLINFEWNSEEQVEKGNKPFQVKLKITYSVRNTQTVILWFVLCLWTILMQSVINWIRIGRNQLRTGFPNREAFRRRRSQNVIGHKWSFCWFTIGAFSHAFRKRYNAKIYQSFWLVNNNNKYPNSPFYRYQYESSYGKCNIFDDFETDYQAR